MSKNTMNILTGLFVLIAAGGATWLFLPAMTASAPARTLPPATLVVSIGPFQVNLMLIVLFVAGGAPFVAIVMALIVRWLGTIAAAPAEASTGAALVASTKRAAPVATVKSEPKEEKPLATGQKIAWLAAIAAAIGLMAILIIQMLPPGFLLF